jgi:heptosyltransferase I
MDAISKHSHSTPRILLTRLSHIGDCVLTLPLLNALRKEYPSAYVAWAVESPSHQLLRLHPGIDQIIKIPRGWMKSPREWIRVRRELRRHQFTISIDPQGITKSAILGWLSGAQQRIGASGRWGRELSCYLNNILIEPSTTHLVDRSLELLRGLNFDVPSSAKFELPICPISLEQIQSWMRSQSLNDSFVVINPGASWPSKRWEIDRFADVANHLWHVHSLRSVVTWAGDEERTMADQILASAADSALAAPPTNLLQLAALCQLAKCFIGCDTGPLHIAAGVGTPCIGLYGTTRPEESGAYGSRHIAVQKWYQDGKCRERRAAENMAMRDIKSDDVCRAVDLMLGRLAQGLRKSG